MFNVLSVKWHLYFMNKAKMSVFAALISARLEFLIDEENKITTGC